jgi:hypothetical protein
MDRRPNATDNLKASDGAVVVETQQLQRRRAVVEKEEAAAGAVGLLCSPVVHYDTTAYNLYLVTS